MEQCPGRRRQISRPSPALSPLVTHSLCFARFLFLRINLKAKLPEMSYKAQLAAQVAFDNAKQLGANKVTTSAKQMNQLLRVQSPALTKRGGAAQEGEWTMKLPGEAIFLSPPVPMVTS